MTKLDFSQSGDATLAEELPEGWVRAQLGAVVWPSKNKIEPSQQPDAPYLGLEHIESHTTKVLGHGRASDVKSTKAVFDAGDVLYGKLRPYLNKVCVPDFAGVCSTDFLVFAQKPWLDSRFLLWSLLRREVVEYANHHSTGVELPRISYDALASLDFWLPPLSEQRRIVDRVQECLAHVNSARDRLFRVPTILKRFRQAVLAAACSGRLTEDWRDNQSACEPTSLLMERVLGERKAGWARTKYRPPSEMDSDDLPDIPESWCWVSFDSLVTDSFYGPRFSTDDYAPEGVPTIRTSDIGFDGSIQLNSPPRLRLSEELLRDLCLRHEDLLVTRTGATIGKCALYEASIGPAIPSAYLIRFRLTRKTIPPKYVLLFLMSPLGQQRLLGGSTAVAQPNVNAKNIGKFPVPLPPRTEITEIVRRVELLLALADTLEERVVAATSRANKLTQSILAKAFRGELVLTEAELARREGRDYEPASVMLERIRAERTDQSKTPPGTKRKMRRTSAHV